MSERGPGNPDFKPGHQIGISGRWKPGQSGNPNGRPKSKPYREALDRMLAAAALDRKIAPEYANDLIAAAHIAKCMSGDMAAIKEYADRTDGKVPNPIGGTDELPPITAFAWKPSPDQIEPPVTGAIKDDSQNDD